VGVVADVYDDGVHLPSRAMVYWPALVDRFSSFGGLFAPRTVTFLVRSSRSGSPDFVDEIRRAVWAARSDIPVAQVRTLGTLYRASMARTSFALVMLAIAAATSLALGAIGIYGAIAYAAAQRRREVGVRVALGAQHKDIRRAFVRQGMTLAAAGLGCGLLVAAGLTRFMKALLFGIDPLDTVTYLAVAALIGVTAAIASYIPARRAALANPIDALRAE
jgi:ABC-type antimicrobial peptide transport system permease subunit